METWGKTLDGEIKSRESNGTIERVRELYKMKRRLPRRYHFFFEKKIQSREQQIIADLQYWLNISEPIIRRGPQCTKKRTKVVVAEIGKEKKEEEEKNLTEKFTESNTINCKE